MDINQRKDTPIYHDSPHGTKQPHGTQDISHIYHDIPNGTEHSPRYSTQDLPPKVS